MYIFSDDEIDHAQSLVLRSNSRFVLVCLYEAYEPAGGFFLWFYARRSSTQAEILLLSKLREYRTNEVTAHMISENVHEAFNERLTQWQLRNL